ncbi:MAG: TetR-like C-terminal domain-containing protein [Anaerovoracaceae bacterium]|jgi:probable dihydroxyacetone kinase regulator
MSALTEKALAASLKKLLAKKTLDKITVKDITDDCGVNRQTFYYHFHDVYDLVEWIFEEDAQRYIASGVSTKNWKEVMSDIMDELMEEKDFVMNTYYSLTRRQLEQYLQKLARPAIRDLVREIDADMNVDRQDEEFVIDFTLYAMSGILAEWIAGGMDDSYRVKMRRIFVALDGILKKILENLQETPQGGER